MWTHVLHFTTKEAAKTWMESETAHVLWTEVHPWCVEENIGMLELDPTAAILGMTHPGAAPGASKPIAWRQAFIVLLNIFPLLCVIKVLLPYIIKEQDHVPVAVLTLIGNLLSVPVLVFILIPFCINPVGIWESRTRFESGYFANRDNCFVNCICLPAMFAYLAT